MAREGSANWSCADSSLDVVPVLESPLLNRAMERWPFEAFVDGRVCLQKMTNHRQMPVFRCKQQCFGHSGCLEERSAAVDFPDFEITSPGDRHQWRQRSGVADVEILAPPDESFNRTAIGCIPIQSTVTTIDVVVSDKLVKKLSQMIFIEHDHVMQ